MEYVAQLTCYLELTINWTLLHTALPCLAMQGTLLIFGDARRILFREETAELTKLFLSLLSMNDANCINFLITFHFHIL